MASPYANLSIYSNILLLIHGVSYKGPLIVFFHNLLKLSTIYVKFLPVVAEEILIRNIRTKCGSWL